MVNRVLIRIKVVQMLYSYLLTRSEFKIETPVETSSADRQYAYTAYAELLLLILKLCGRRTIVTGEEDKQAKALADDAIWSPGKMSIPLMSHPSVKELIAQHGNDVRRFDSAVPDIISAIKRTANYRSFAKTKRPELGDEVNFWIEALRTITHNEAAETALRANETFSVRGLDMGVKMLANTLRGLGDTRSALITGKNDLDRSLRAAYELYVNLIWLPVELTRALRSRLDAAADKYLPTDRDLNPDRRLADARFISLIEENASLNQWIEENGLTVATDPLLIEGLLDDILASNDVQEYMAQEGEKTIEQEEELWRRLLRTVITTSDDFLETLENKSIFWNDDLELMLSFALKSMRQIAQNPQTVLLPEFKDEEDAAFGPELFDNAVNHLDDYRSLIDQFINTGKWDTERLALMDMVILRTALAEIMEFPKIPLQVTVNEYVEIAKAYSSPRSGAFINGILAAIANSLHQEGKLAKTF